MTPEKALRIAIRVLAAHPELEAKWLWQKKRVKR